LLDLAVPRLAASVAAVALMLLSGIANINAILRTDWQL
jgi:hypothetical protein